MKNTRLKFIFSILVVLFCLYVAIPSTFPIKFSLGGFNVDQNFSKSFLNQDLKLGLDLVGGSRLTYQANLEGRSGAEREEAVEALLRVIEKRVNLFGVSESSVLRSSFGGNERIVVELPGIDDLDSAKQLVGKTAQLVFAEVKGENELASTDLTGSDLRSARVAYDTVSGAPVISIEFTDEGSRKFEELTGRNVGKPIPIVLDDQIISAPVVNEKIIGGKAQISGDFDVETAKSLSVQLTAGALPVSISLVEERTIGASLGESAVVASVTAGMIGLGLVAAFMILIYRKLGIIACIGLISFAIISLAIYKLIPITLTLPGIAGFLLSVGMAVDSNILTFERFKEEKAKGLPVAAAMELAFGRAWDSIRDANIATLIAAFILANPLDWNFLNVSGPVRGFAYTLALGIFVSLFTGVFMGRNMVRLFIKK